MLLGSVSVSVAETGFVLGPFLPLFKKTQKTHSLLLRSSLQFIDKEPYAKANSGCLINCNNLLHYIPETFHFVQ